MRILVTGARGQLGSAFVDAAPDDWQLIPTDRSTLDLTDGPALRRFVADVAPDVIINCAAYTDVDGAQTDEATCWAVNAQVPEVLADSPARLIQVSTDYVFDGTATQPYSEDSPVSGLGVYGRSKAAGELAVAGKAAVVRTAWLYGPSGSNFVKTILRAATAGKALKVVDDQVGQPTYAPDVAEQILAMIRAGVAPGVFHATNSGQTSWFGFARQIVKDWGIDAEIEPVGSEAFPRPAPRPRYSVLGHDAWAAIGLLPLRGWREALTAAHSDYGAEFLH